MRSPQAVANAMPPQRLRTFAIHREIAWNYKKESEQAK
jgi:hypothetical protein